MKNLIIYPVNYMVTLVDRMLFRNKDFVIISNNCWGGFIYQRLGVPYKTPFIGLFIYGPDYIKLLENLDHFLTCKLLFKKNSKWFNHLPSYPVGVLGDIEIHFLHYKDEKEAFLKWNRRLKRMKEIENKDNYFYKICDRDLGNKEVLRKFHTLPFRNKVSFGVFDLNEKNHIKIENYSHQCVPEGDILYKQSFNHFDPLKWIHTRNIHHTFYNKIKFKIGLV